MVPIDFVNILLFSLNAALAKSSRQAICLFPSWKAIVTNTKKPDDLQLFANHPDP